MKTLHMNTARDMTILVLMRKGIMLSMLDIRDSTAGFTKDRMIYKLISQKKNTKIRILIL